MRPALRQLLAAAQRPTPGSELAAPAAATAPAVALDFETFYRSEQAARRLGLPPCSVETHGNWAYCRQPEWEAYLVSVYAPACPALGLSELAYAGPPAGAPWAALAGRTWLSHNRNFDRHAYERLVELGQAPAIAYSEWHDTADLAAYCHLPRALGRILALRHALALDKDARAGMDGRRWAGLPEPDRTRLLAYALEDAAACWLVWAELSPGWPEPERRLSLHTGQLEFRGVPVDRALVDRDLGLLETALWRARARIPWVDQDDADTGRPYALGSRKALDRECLKCGVPPPATTAQKSPEFLAWLDAHGARVPAIAELSRHRRLDRALHLYRALRQRLRPDGRAALGLKYLGAEKTGRWSGAGQFNLQNLAKAPLYLDSDYGWLDPAPGGGRPAAAAHAIDIRACLRASPGRRLVIADLAQIEPRVLAWLVGHREFLAHCAAGLSPYEAHAAASGHRWEGRLKHTQPALYALFKARLLALGYGAGWHKFIEMARGYCETEAQFLAIFAVPPAPEQERRFARHLAWLAAHAPGDTARRQLAAWPELDAQTRAIWVNAWLQVDDFRRTHPAIADRQAGLWARLDRAFRAAVRDGVFENQLPSGRALKYFAVTPQPGWSCRPGHPLAPPQRTYGGLLAENLVQAAARDIFAHGLLALAAAGYDILFHVHDEAVIDAPADADPAEIRRLLCTPPPWCPDLPLAAETEISGHYKK